MRARAAACRSRRGGRRPRSRSFGRGAEDDARVEVDLAPDEAARRRPPRRRPSTTRVEALARRVRDRHEHDVRARSARARGRARRVAPSTWTPCTLRRRRRGLSSTKPTTRSPAVSRSSRIRLRPVRPAPTISVRRPVRSRTDCAPLTIARSAKRDAADRDHADQRVDDEERAREVAHVLRQHHERRARRPRRRRPRRRSRPRRARRRSARPSGRGRRG